MTVKELKDFLSSFSDTTKISVTVADPQDAAYTTDVRCKADADGNIELYGWVASDNDSSWAPWAGYT